MARKRNGLTPHRGSLRREDSPARFFALSGRLAAQFFALSGRPYK